MKSKTAGRPVETIAIRGAILKKSIKAKYKSMAQLAAALDTAGAPYSRVWISQCLNSDRMTPECLDAICRLLNHAPEYYRQDKKVSLLLDDRGELTRIPSYAWSEQIKINLTYRTAVRALLTVFECPEDIMNIIIHDEFEFLRLLNGLNRAIHDGIDHASRLKYETDANGITWTSIDF